MKKHFRIFALFFILFTGCKKTVENALNDAIIKSMTDGQWAVTSFTENGADITSDFSGFTFQYHGDMTVDAIRNGVVEKSGTWSGDAVAKSTWADFPNCTAPLALLNGTWHITNNTLTYVKATQTIGSESRAFRIDKQ